MVTGARLEQERNSGNMATHSSPRLDNGAKPSQEEEAGCDPPQLPVIVPNSVQGNVSSSSDPLDGEVPAVVSITRVPAKPKQPEGPPVGGLKVRTDLSAPKPGPPPLLRVTGGGAPTRPALPPMPRLKLGGQRFPSSNHMNGMMNRMNQAQLGQRSPTPGILSLPQPAIGSLSLRSLTDTSSVQSGPLSMVQIQTLCYRCCYGMISGLHSHKGSNCFPYAIKTQHILFH